MSVVLTLLILLSQFRLDIYTNSINDSIIAANTIYFPLVKSIDEEKNEIIDDPSKKCTESYKNSHSI